MDDFFTLLFVASLGYMIYRGVHFGWANLRHGRLRRNTLISGAVIVISFIGVGITAPSTDLTPKQAATKIRQAKTTQQDLKTDLAAATAKKATLTKQKKALLAETAAAKKAAKGAKAKQAEVASKAAAASSATASSQAATESQAAADQAKAANQAKAAAQPKAATNHGDMNTADKGTIVGNARSHIYHVPGQAGYRMNSSNAVYFQSEAAAQAAGYRRAKR